METFPLNISGLLIKRKSEKHGWDLERKNEMYGRGKLDLKCTDYANDMHKEIVFTKRDFV